MGKKAREKQKKLKIAKRLAKNPKRKHNAQMREGNVVGNQEKEKYFLMLNELKEKCPEGDYSRFVTKGDVPKELYKILRVKYNEKMNPPQRHYFQQPDYLSNNNWGGF